MRKHRPIRSAIAMATAECGQSTGRAQSVFEFTRRVQRYIIFQIVIYVVAWQLAPSRRPPLQAAPPAAAFFGRELYNSGSPLYIVLSWLVESWSWLVRSFGRSDLT